MRPTVPSYIDVLIVGAGPAGLMAATWMSRCGIKTRIIDKRDDKIFRGQADGLQSRTFEIFDSFGFGQQAWQDSNHMLEMCLWNPAENGRLRRSSIVVDTIPGISRFQHATLHQGRIEEYFLAGLKEHGGIEVERSVMPASIEVDDSELETQDAYPITVKLQQIEDNDAMGCKNTLSVPNGLFRSNLTTDDTTELLQQSYGIETQETIKAKYVIGCDGAHSWVRKQLGFEMQGEQTDYVWGVLDIIPITDFPDIRKRCAIHSANSGSMMIIPRENRLTRIYCQLKETKRGTRANGISFSPQAILKQAQQIIAPYSLEYKHCNWYTAYQIGQRVASQFSYKDRIFLAGDAVHTHSPKAGQGMNVSMHDTYNLGWKIAAVIKGISGRHILTTYQVERRKVAQDLIDFDHKFSRMFSGRPAKDANDREGINMNDFKAAYEKSNLFTCGISVDYGPSVITANDEMGKGSARRHDLARNIKTGTRMPSYQVLNQADARPWQLQEAFKSNGRWRIVVFAGDVTVVKQMERVRILGRGLDSLLRRFTPPSEPIDSRIEVITVHSSPRFEVEIFDFPEVMRPFKYDLGWDYDKIFVDSPSYHQGDGKAYQNYGVDARSGCIVVLRPDQHVSFVGDLADTEDVKAFFSAFMKQPAAY